MSRSNPTERLANPAVRWWEWNGQHGHLSYWDKDAQKRQVEPLPFTCLLLDELQTVTGWDDASDSRIFCNEIRDSTRDPLVVKSFTGGILYEGLYIKKEVEAVGGHFTTSLYVAFKQDDAYRLGNVKLSRTSLSAWVDFKKETQKAKASDLYSKAVVITGYSEGQKGSVKYRKPVFALTNISSAAESAALALDKELQTYLTSYLKRATVDQADAHTTEDPEPITAESIPF
jgi:hypothetical protein